MQVLDIASFTIFFVRSIEKRKDVYCMILSSVPIKHIKTVRESSAGYDFSVIAYRVTIISHY